ncbi:hypothetical protein N7492_000397 [Penicillium capsulatum]|uniref:Uncharacterized protein n=1 Tax=Penicillium capsulatum TaxID=69766 RepID=A0A9W9ISR2_9EURO|nr:hypothetical protein N7492_000397 [Penicillium capsulatum]KAJ6130541.1 hypothetical protein N7512_003321 [Penicillium capsulatum]
MNITHGFTLSWAHCIRDQYEAATRVRRHPESTGDEAARYPSGRRFPSALLKQPDSEFGEIRTSGELVALKRHRPFPAPGGLLIRKKPGREAFFVAREKRQVQWLDSIQQSRLSDEHHPGSNDDSPRLPVYRERTTRNTLSGLPIDHAGGGIRRRAEPLHRVQIK